MQPDEDPDLDRIEQVYAFARASLKARVIGPVRYHSKSNEFTRLRPDGSAIETLTHHRMRQRVQRALVREGVTGDRYAIKRKARELLREVKAEQCAGEAET